jgi:beta-N-acetylhexosaminidase
MSTTTRAILQYAPSAQGEDVGRLAAAYVQGLHAGGMLATLKHFPGHGDTDVDSHLGLPIISQPRERLDSVELPPFRAGIASGADAIMTAHIVLPALDSREFSPASLSQPIVTGLLRGELKFAGSSTRIHSAWTRCRAVGR